MLKLSVTQGPIVNGENVGVVISSKHVKEITNFLCEWYETIPAGVAKHIEVLRVGPSVGKHEYGRVVIEVILSADSSRINVKGASEGFAVSPWKSSIGYCFYNYEAYGDIWGADKRGDVESELNERLKNLIRHQSESHQAQHKYFESLSSLFEKPESQSL